MRRSCVKNFASAGGHAASMTTDNQQPLAPLGTEPDASPALTKTPDGRGNPWLPVDFQHPLHVPVTARHHLRPIRATDVDLDLPAVNSSRERLFSIYGPAWSWPPVAMTREQDEADLARHEQEIRDHLSFNYALFDHDETALLGCVYLDPATRSGFDVEVSWWVVDGQVGSALEASLESLVPTWLRDHWPFTRPVFPGRDLSWAEYLALPGR